MLEVTADIYHCHCNGCDSGPKNSTNLDRHSSELYLQCSQVQTDDNQEACSPSTVQIGEGAWQVQADRYELETKSKDRRQLGLPGQRRGDVVRD